MMTDASRLRGLYAINPERSRIEDEDAAAASLIASMSLALQGGASMVQYRDKTSDHGRRLREAGMLRTLCVQHQALLIINDDVELALAISADGVHLGQGDMSVADARARLGKAAIIGASCHDSLDLARSAAAAGADYVAFGAVFPSTTKPETVAAPLALIGAARQTLGLPVCAIGGITVDNAAQVVAAGADMLAVIHGLFGASDVRSAAQHIAQLF